MTYHPFHTVILSDSEPMTYHPFHTVILSDSEPRN